MARFHSRLALVLFALQAAAAAAQLSANPPSIDFGGQSMSTTAPAIDVLITNNGGTTANVSGVTVGDGQFAQTSDCTTLGAGASCTVHVTFTPAISAGDLNATFPVSSTLSVASDAPGSPLSVALAGIAERSLVTHYYRAILRRAPDATGKKFWQDEAQRVVGMDANVNETWFAMAAYFYRSAEYAAYARDNAGFVTDLYKTFFNRPPDAQGLAFWTDQLAQGLPREVALASFVFSTEFRDFSAAIFGNAAARSETDLVMDSYRGMLARLPDDGGLVSYAESFRDTQCNNPGAIPAAATNTFNLFLQSTEYALRLRNNPQFVGDLYNALLRRGGDLQGVQFFVNALNTRSRFQVAQDIIASPEYQGRVAAVANAGCVSRGTRVSLGSTRLGQSVIFGADGFPLVAHLDFMTSVGWMVMSLKCSTATCTGASQASALDGPYPAILSAVTRFGRASDGLPLLAYTTVNSSQSTTPLRALKCGSPGCGTFNTMGFLQGEQMTRGEFAMADGLAVPDGRPLFVYASPGIVVEKCSDAQCTASSRVGFGVGYKPGVAIGADGLPVVAYDSIEQGVVAVKCGNPACSSGNLLGVVDPEVTGPTDQSGVESVAVAIGQDGFPIMAYTVRRPTATPPRKVVKFARCADAACATVASVTEIDASLDGSNISLAVPADGRPLVAYRTTTSSTAKVVRCGNAGCTSGNTVTTIPGIGWPIANVTLTVAPSGKPFLVLQQSTTMTALTCDAADCR